jgi:hypothetical protein
MGWLRRIGTKSELEQRIEELNRLVNRWTAGGVAYEEFARERDRIVADGDSSRRFGPHTALVQTWLNALDDITATEWRWVGTEAQPIRWSFACQVADRESMGTDRDLPVRAASFGAVLLLLGHVDRWLHALQEMKDGAKELPESEELVDTMWHAMGRAVNEYASKAAGALVLVDRLPPEDFATLYSPWTKVIPLESMGL